jgi:multidrug efflux pump subunit AcrA (membrane-fusion protein)
MGEVSWARDTHRDRYVPERDQCRPRLPGRGRRNAHAVHAGGRVSFISPVIDPGSGTVQVIVRVKRDPKKVLRPGMAVRLTLGAAAARR